MSAPSWEEMEAKRQEMITSFKDIAAAMTRCVSVIEDYTRLTPSTLSSATHGAQTVDSNTLPAQVRPPGSEPNGKPIKAKKEKKPKDPNAPKRPPSAYIIFQNQMREAIRKDNPGKPYKEVLTILAEKWKNLDGEQKKVYDDAYQDAQSSFRVKDDAYKAGGTATTPAPAPAAPFATDSSSDDSSSHDSDDSEPTPAPLPTIAPSNTTPRTMKAVPLPAPATLNAVVSSDNKKEKKRKNKEDEAAVAATLQPEGEKKKKKKSKE